MKTSIKARLARLAAKAQPPCRVIFITGTPEELDRKEAELTASGELLPSDVLFRTIYEGCPDEQNA